MTEQEKAAQAQRVAEFAEMEKRAVQQKKMLSEIKAKLRAMDADDEEAQS